MADQTEKDKEDEGHRQFRLQRIEVGKDRHGEQGIAADGQHAGEAIALHRLDEGVDQPRRQEVKSNVIVLEDFGRLRYPQKLIEPGGEEYWKNLELAPVGSHLQPEGLPRDREVEKFGDPQAQGHPEKIGPIVARDRSVFEGQAEQAADHEDHHKERPHPSERDVMCRVRFSNHGSISRSRGRRGEHSPPIPQ